MFDCSVVEKTSKKGVKFICLEVTFPSGYKKLVFLEPAEQHLVKQYIAE